MGQSYSAKPQQDMSNSNDVLNLREQIVGNYPLKDPILSLLLT